MIQCLSNCLECVDSSRCDMINMNRVGIFVIPNHRILGPNFFNFKNIFMLSIFEKFVANKIFNFTFRCAMPRQCTVVKIQYNDDQTRYVSTPLHGTGNLWAWAFNVIDGLLPILLSAFHPKSTLISLPLLRRPKGKSLSMCPHLSMGVLAWL